jgi:hypothetical protein
MSCLDRVLWSCYTYGLPLTDQVSWGQRSQGDRASGRQGSFFRPGEEGAGYPGHRIRFRAHVFGRARRCMLPATLPIAGARHGARSAFQRGVLGTGRGFNARRLGDLVLSPRAGGLAGTDLKPSNHGADDRRLRLKGIARSAPGRDPTADRPERRPADRQRGRRINCEVGGWAHEVSGVARPHSDRTGSRDRCGGSRIAGTTKRESEIDDFNH